MTRPQVIINYSDIMSQCIPRDIVGHYVTLNTLTHGYMTVSIYTLNKRKAELLSEGGK